MVIPAIGANARSGAVVGADRSAPPCAVLVGEPALCAPPLEHAPRPTSVTRRQAMRADDRLATIVSMTSHDRAREIWNFEGLPGDLDEMLGRSWGPRSNDEVLLEFADRADLRPASVVVDVGCYDASRSEPLVHKTGCRLVGVDISRRGADARRARAGTSGPDRRLSFIQGRLEAIPVRDEIADLTRTSSGGNAPRRRRT